MKTQQITIVDYGMGNLHSVHKALSHVADKNMKIVVSNLADDIKKASRLVLPGQGAIAGCMAHIQAAGLYEPIVAASKRIPFLAICVGPQLLMRHSEENGGVDGFHIFAGECVKFPDEFLTRTPPLKIPHMGWSEVKQTQAHPLWHNIADNSRFYFVHSYYLKPEEESTVVGSCDYGFRFASALARDNIFTTQCHPEKSADVGLQLFHNFLRWQP